MDYFDNSKIKAFFIDLDGTLLDEGTTSSGHYPSNFNIHTLREIQKKRNQYAIIATGRSYADTVMYGKAIDAEFVICQNGATIYNKQGELVRSYPLPSKTINFVAEMAESHNLAFLPSGSKYVYGIKNLFLRWTVRRIKMAPIRDYSVNTKSTYYKLLLIGRKNKLEMIKNIIDESHPELNAAFQRASLEITSVDASKGKAIQFVSSDVLNITNKEDIVHIGDSGNDASAAPYVGKLIAMGNSSKRLLRVATHIGPDYKKGGVAQIVLGKYSIKPDVVKK